MLTSPTRSLTRPIVDYLQAVEASGDHERLVVLIPEMHLPHPRGSAERGRAPRPPTRPSARTGERGVRGPGGAVQAVRASVSL